MNCWFDLKMQAGSFVAQSQRTLLSADDHPSPFLQPLQLAVNTTGLAGSFIDGPFAAPPSSEAEGASFFPFIPVSTFFVHAENQDVLFVLLVSTLVLSIVGALSALVWYRQQLKQAAASAPAKPHSRM